MTQIQTPPGDDRQSAVQVADRGLVRAIGLRGAVLIVISSVIGSAIFLTPGTMAATLPSEPLLLLAWVAGGVIALCGGLTYAEMGAMYPNSGGLYLFLEKAFGPLTAFLYGWTAQVVILNGATAAVAVGFAEYFAYFVPAFSSTHVLLAIHLPWGLWLISAAQVVAAVVLLAFGVVNYFGVESGEFLQSAITILKVAAIAILPLTAIALHPAKMSFTPAVPHVASPAVAFGIVMIAVMWAYEGWYYLPFCAGEIKDAQRTLPRALAIGILIIVAIYLSVNVAYMLALPLDRIKGVERIAEKAMVALIGSSGGRLMAATIVLSTLGCIAAAVLTTSRACYALAADGLFFRAAAKIHPRYKAPSFAVALTCGWSALLALTGTYEQLFTWVTFTSVAFGALSGVAIFRLRRTQPNVPRPYRVWGYPFVPGLFLVALGVLVVNTLIEKPVESLLGLAVVALGLPAYWYWSRSRA